MDIFKWQKKRIVVNSLRPANLLKRRLWHKCFLVNFTKFLRTSFSQSTCGRLFLRSARCFLLYLCVSSYKWKIVAAFEKDFYMKTIVIIVPTILKYTFYFIPFVRRKKTKNACSERVALYFKVIPNRINLCKWFFLHVISARIMVSW